MQRLRLKGRLAVFATAVLLSLAAAPNKQSYSPRERAFYAADATVEFVRPGLVITINSAKIAADGTMTVVYTVTDPKGLPLDTAGITTPGIVTLSFVASYIPNGQEQYVPYTTRSATGAVSGTVNQAGADAGGPSGGKAREVGAGGIPGDRRRGLLRIPSRPSIGGFDSRR